MDFTNTPRDVTPHRPDSSSPPRPHPERRVFSDFTQRPAQPIRPPQPHHPKPIIPVVTASPLPPMPHPPATAMASAIDPAPKQTLVPPDLPPAHHAKEPKPSHPSSHSTHAGVVGFVLFVVLAALLLSPLLPGKILDNFPGSSQSSSSGDQTIGCSDEPTNVASVTSYTTKVGSPIVYNYSTTTTQTGTCGGQKQSAVSGHGSQFNPLGLAIDIAAALAVAIGVAQVWRKIFSAKD